MSYSFDIKILKGTAYADRSIMQNCSEFLISSKKFDDISSCEASFADVMGDLAQFENISLGKNYVVISKNNPAGNEKTTEVWDDSVIYKLYIVDSDLLKKSIFDCKIFGQLKIVA